MVPIPWFKVDDRFHASRKVKSIPRSRRMPALGLWVSAGSWSAGEGLDGFVPEYMLDEFGGDEDMAELLVRSGLWEECEGGWRFYKWTEYNPDAVSIEASREAMQEGARHGNHKRWHAKKGIKVPGCEWCDPASSGTRSGTRELGESPPNPPDPARPDPLDSYVPEDSLVSSPPASRRDVEHILNVLDREIARNGSTVPNRSKKNLDAARLLIDKDGRTVDQIVRAIQWAQGNEFWRSNILSMSKLREKYDQLRLQAQREKDQDKQSGRKLTNAEIAALDYQEKYGSQGSAPAIGAGVSD